MKKIFASALGLALSLTATLPSAETLNGAGATFPYPVYSAWAYDYSKATGTQLNYQSIGSGGGIKQITDRTVDFGASDNPLKPEELAKANLLQFPAVMGGVVLAINIDGVTKTGELKLDGETLSKIFLGEIKNWNDPLLVKLNPGIKLPDAPITVVYRSDGSGTTSIFTHYLSAVSPDWQKNVGAGTAVQFPVGIGGKGNEGVANYLQRTSNSIGYVEFAYAQQNKLNYTQLKNAAGQFVLPSLESFEAAGASANFDPAQSFYLFIANAPGKDAWPIAGATFILLAKDKTEANKKVVNFYNWAFKNGDAKAKELIYVPLPDSLKEKIRTYWKANGIL